MLYPLLLANKFALNVAIYLLEGHDADFVARAVVAPTTISSVVNHCNAISLVANHNAALRAIVAVVHNDARIERVHLLRVVEMRRAKHKHWVVANNVDATHVA